MFCLDSDKTLQPKISHVYFQCLPQPKRKYIVLYIAWNISRNNGILVEYTKKQLIRNTMLLPGVFSIYLILMFTRRLSLYALYKTEIFSDTSTAKQIV